MFLLVCQLLRHCRKECLRVLGGRISFMFITLKGQCKSVAAVFLLSLLNFILSGHCTPGCIHGSPVFKLWNPEWCHGAQKRVLRCLLCNYFPLVYLSGRPQLSWRYEAKQTPHQLSTWKRVGMLATSVTITALACMSHSPSSTTSLFIEGTGNTFDSLSFTISIPLFST